MSDLAQPLSMLPEESSTFDDVCSPENSPATIPASPSNVNLDYSSDKNLYAEPNGSVTTNGNVDADKENDDGFSNLIAEKRRLKDNMKKPKERTYKYTTYAFVL